MKTWKRVMGLVLSVVLMVSTLPISALADYGKDDPATTENNLLVDLDEADYASQDDNFVLLSTVPTGMIVKDGLTRAEWMKDLVLLFGISIPEDEYPDLYFPDISEGMEYFDDIMTAIKYGVVSIEAGDDFEPEAPLTREFAAQTLNACLGMQKSSETYTYNDMRIGFSQPPTRYGGERST